VGARALLSSAAALIDRDWSQGADARDAAGCPTEPWSADARSWSLLGALVSSVETASAATGETLAIRDLAEACALLATILDVASLAEWNDDPERTKADVAEVLRRALQLDSPNGNPSLG
jgi:hypothetical protein